MGASNRARNAQTIMQSHLLAGPIFINGCGGFSSSSSSSSSSLLPHHHNRRNRHRRWGPIASSSSATHGGKNIKNHYEVLGITRSATSSEIKRAYRLLALKFHPDVSKDSQAEEVFLSIRQAYEILSNQATRTQYDQALKLTDHEGRMYNGKQNYSPNFDTADRINRWDELRQNMRHSRYYQEHHTYSVYETDKETEEEDNEEVARGCFSEVLRSAFLSLFLMQTLGSLASLTVSCLMAFLDQKLDSGYKVGYFMALILGGRGGVLLTMCLSFTSWAFGKTSSSKVALVTVALWVGSHLARYVAIPRGALLALLHISMKMP